jgi:quinol monooxygenase YgiN
MKKVTMLTLAICATGLFACQTKTETSTPKHLESPSGTAREVAVYRVKPEKMADFRTIHAAMTKEVEAMPGCLGLRSMRQSDDTTGRNNTFVDICEWRSLADAHAAQTAVMKNTPAAVQAFFGAVEANVLFGNFEMHNTAQ